MKLKQSREPSAVLSLCLVLLVADVRGAPPAPTTAPATVPSARNVLKDLTAPAGFEMTLFAAPPRVNYPACLTATARGEVFVGIDEQGSLGRDAGRGRIVRCVDTDGDGARHAREIRHARSTAVEPDARGSGQPRRVSRVAEGEMTSAPMANAKKPPRAKRGGWINAWGRTRRDYFVGSGSGAPAAAAPSRVIAP